MKMILLERPEDAATEATRKRSKESCTGKLTKHYAVWENGQEVALLSLEYFPANEYPPCEYPRDQFPETDRLDIYEIFVPHEFRNRGIGTKTLVLAEQHARELGLSKTHLHARPLLNNPRTQDEMIQWYRRRGYEVEENQSDPSTLEKNLTP